MAKVAESGIGRKDLVVVNSHLSSPMDEFRAAQSERKRAGEMNYHSSIDILLKRAAVANAMYTANVDTQPAPKLFDLFELIMH